MNEADDLRHRIAATDPAADVSPTPADDPRMRALLEDIVNTPFDTPDTAAEPSGGRTRQPAKEFLIGIWAVAAVAVLVVGGIILFSGGDEPEVADPTPATTAAPTGPAPTDPAPSTVRPIAPLSLSLGQGQDPAASCIRPSAEVLAPVELAFAGTAAVVDGERVVLDVTQWYTGGDAAQIEVTAPAGLEALTGGIPFEVGGEYLISATAGVVNYCGLSGPATPELQAIFDGAFPG